MADVSEVNMLAGPEWAQYQENLKRGKKSVYTGQPFIEKVLGGEDIPIYDRRDYASQTEASIVMASFGYLILVILVLAVPAPGFVYREWLHNRGNSQISKGPIWPMVRLRC